MEITEYQLAMVRIEGHGLGRRKIRRSVRQGCPFLPWIFNLGLEPLAIWANREIEGIHFEGWEIKISMYADNGLCYLGNPLLSLSAL